jgi:hypothetical protein
MSDDLLRQLPGAWSPESAGQFTRPPNQPGVPSENPFEELDRNMPTQPAPRNKVERASATVGKNPFEALDSPEIADVAKAGTVGRIAKQAALGAFRLGPRALGGIVDLARGLPEDTGSTAERWMQRSGLMTPENAPRTRGERIADIAGTLAPGVLAAPLFGGSMIPAAASAIGSTVAGPYARKAAQAAGITNPRLLNAAELIGGTAFGLGAGGVAGKITGGPHIPTEAELKEAGAAGLNQVRGSGIKVDPNTVANDIIFKFQNEAGEGADILAPKTFGLMNKLRPPEIGDPVDISKIMAIRTKLGKIKPTMEGAQDALYAGKARAAIDDYLNNLPNNMHYVMEGHEAVPGMAQTFADANANYSAYMRAKQLRQRTDAGMLRTGTTYTGGNMVNAIRQKVGWITDPLHPERQRGWSPEELQTLNRIGRGTTPQNMLRLAARLAPDNQLNLLANIGAMGGAALTGNPAFFSMAGASGAGLGARQLGRALQKRDIGRLSAATRMRSPLFKGGPGGPGLGAGAEEAGEAGLAATIAEKAPEAFHHAVNVGTDVSGSGEEKDKDKEARAGGYEKQKEGLGNRLHLAANMAMGRMKHRGGYDEPTEEFADPESFRLRAARVAARPMPQTQPQPPAQNPYAALLSNPQAQTAIGGGLTPYPQMHVGAALPHYQIGGYGSSPGAPLGGGGYDWFGGGEAKSYRQIVQPPAGHSKYFLGSFSTVSKPHPPPKGGASMESPQEDEEDTGGYDPGDPLGTAMEAGNQYLRGGVPGMLSSMGYNVPPWVTRVGRVVRNPDLSAAMGATVPLGQSVPWLVKEQNLEYSPDKRDPRQFDEQGRVFHPSRLPEGARTQTLAHVPQALAAHEQRLNRMQGQMELDQAPGTDQQPIWPYLSMRPGMVGGPRIGRTHWPVTPPSEPSTPPTPSRHLEPPWKAAAARQGIGPATVANMGTSSKQRLVDQEMERTVTPTPTPSSRTPMEFNENAMGDFEGYKNPSMSEIQEMMDNSDNFESALKFIRHDGNMYVWPAKEDETYYHGSVSEGLGLGDGPGGTFHERGMIDEDDLPHIERLGIQRWGDKLSEARGSGDGNYSNWEYLNKGIGHFSPTPTSPAESSAKQSAQPTPKAPSPQVLQQPIAAKPVTPAKPFKMQPKAPRVLNTLQRMRLPSWEAQDIRFGGEGGYDDKSSAQTYLQGGVPGLLAQHGYQVPGWINSIGQYLNNPDIQSAMGMIMPMGNTKDLAAEMKAAGSNGLRYFKGGNTIYTGEADSTLHRDLAQAAGFKDENQGLSGFIFPEDLMEIRHTPGGLPKWIDKRHEFYQALNPKDAPRYIPEWMKGGQPGGYDTGWPQGPAEPAGSLSQTYQGVRGMLDTAAAPIVAEHSQPWSLGRGMNVLQNSLMGLAATPEAGMIARGAAEGSSGPPTPITFTAGGRQENRSAPKVKKMPGGYNDGPGGNLLDSQTSFNSGGYVDRRKLRRFGGFAASPLAGGSLF